MEDTYYFLKPLIPRLLQIRLRSQIISRKRLSHRYADIWPIDKNASNSPVGWSGWPNNKRFALVLTHDVDTSKGQENCYPLIRIEESLDFRSSFNFVPADYSVSFELRRYLNENGFEVGLHGLTHRGNLFKSKKVFQKKVSKINHHLREWGSVGFRAPCMFHNLDWIHDLNIEYDTSTFDTDPFEPQPDGMGTIFPFWVQKNATKKGYVELPYTLPQDFTLFVLMKEKHIGIWKKKLDWVAQQGGMALLLTHPDYMNFATEKLRYDQYPVEYYAEFLDYIKTAYDGQYWHVLPKDLARFWASYFSKRIRISVG